MQCDHKEKYSCSGHNINLSLKNTFNNENEEIVKIKFNIENVKSLVTLMKRKGLIQFITR